MRNRPRSRVKVNALPASRLAQYEFFHGIQGVYNQVTCHLVGVIAALALLACLSGCSNRYMDMPAFWPIESEEPENFGPGRFKTSFLAKQIDEFYRGSNPGPIGVTTFVNIDDLYVTSTFGRMLSEQMMSELTMRGFDVVELRHADALQFLDSTGEFALSRDVRVVRPERNLSAVIVGTYVVSPQRVYVNARLVDPSSSMVISAGSVEMSKTKEMTKLLRGGSAPQSLERIPVRHLGYAAQPINIYDPMRRNQWAQEEGSSWGGELGAPRRNNSATRLAPLEQLPAAAAPRRRLQPIPAPPAESAPAAAGPDVAVSGGGSGSGPTE